MYQRTRVNGVERTAIIYRSSAFGAVRAGSSNIKRNAIQYKRHLARDNGFACVLVVTARCGQISTEFDPVHGRNENGP